MNRLSETISDRLLRPAPPAVDALCDEMRSRYGDALLAIVFYGSCLRNDDAMEGIVDLYVIVSSYADAIASRKHRLLAHFLPPTVGYLEAGDQQNPVRAKYAVISLDDFQRGTSRRWFHSYLWGRFAQPCLLAHARDDLARDAVVECLSSAATTLITRSLPLAPSPIDAASLWALALGNSYRTELRVESPERASELVGSDLPYYEALTRALAEYPLQGRLILRETAEGAVYDIRGTGWQELRSRFSWGVRRLTGKFMNLARLFKALATFEGGLDYAAWKLERHSGVKVTISDKVRRRPWLYMWGELIRLYRSGALR